MKLTKPQIRLLSRLRGGGVLHHMGESYGGECIFFSAGEHAGWSIATLYALAARSLIESYDRKAPPRRCKWRITPAGRAALGAEDD